MPKRTEPIGIDDESYNTVGMTTYKVIKRASLGLVSDEALTQSRYYALRVIAKNGAMLNEEDE